MLSNGSHTKKERPALFAELMAQRTLERRKTQTRRTNGLDAINEFPDSFAFVREQDGYPDGRTRFIFEYINDGEPGGFKCPYGEVGDRLWVRETSYIWGCWTKNGVTKSDRQKWKFHEGRPRAVMMDGVHADVATKKTPREVFAYWKRPSIFMPRWASRITLEIVSIHVERLNDISESDAQCEGWNWEGCDLTRRYDPVTMDTARRWFRGLWDSINGAGEWDKNPWVWVVKFKLVNL